MKLSLFDQNYLDSRKISQDRYAGWPEKNFALMKNMFSKKKKHAKIRNVHLLTNQHKMKQTYKQKFKREIGRDCLTDPIAYSC